MSRRGGIGLCHGCFPWSNTQAEPCSCGKALGSPLSHSPKLCQEESSKDGHELWFHIVVIFGEEVGCALGTLPSLAGSICDLVLL